ncbi:MAG: hypothetical protein EHM33_11380 [Chloroflexi bacterium]|nr:MAG: hypothetical protein EHM33_11380 [Chloroflexota bacterium]
MNTFNRRDFLKLTGLVLASSLVLPKSQAIENGTQLFADPQIRFGKVLIRGTAHGRILSSTDDGNTWETFANLGEQHAVLQFTQKDEKIYANLGAGIHDFWLKSADAQKWFAV